MRDVSLYAQSAINNAVSGVTISLMVEIFSEVRWSNLLRIGVLKQPENVAKRVLSPYNDPYNSPKMEKLKPSTAL